jgi:glycosyltransferase involved in cell wall biosynthesis
MAAVPVSVVVITRDGRDALVTTLGRLSALPERPEIVVVDNASTDAAWGRDDRATTA